MEYKIFEDRIEIKKSDDFNIGEILECGQIFRFKKQDFGYILYYGSEKATIYCQKDTIIYCKNPKSMQKYLDLETDYAKIKEKLGEFELMKDAISYGKGIRILKQNPLEMLISFIISANNNIPRIKGTIEKICEGYGEKHEDYYAFPDLKALKKIPLEFFKSCGCGYRAEYLVETIKSLDENILNSLFEKSLEEARAELIKFKGVGRKVADCILLFGYGKTGVFPTDTWIEKVYLEKFKEELPAKKVSDKFAEMFGDLSGYAQQYLYFERMNRKNDKEKNYDWN